MVSKKKMGQAEQAYTSRSYNDELKAKITKNLTISERICNTYRE